MALTTKQIEALDLLPLYQPALAPDRTGGDALKLGTELAAVGAGLTPGVVTDLQTAATATAVADATDLATAIALVNDLKAKYNALVAGIDAL